MREAFRAMSAESLSKSAQDFLKLAEQRLSAQHKDGAAEIERRRIAVEQLVKPIEETLKKTGEHLAAIEKERTGAYSGLVEQVRAMSEGNTRLRDETGKLVRALREPQVRGRYGEIQLKKVAELAGMRPYCDFVEQETTRGEDGAAMRPDMIVKLPNGREVAVDAKANLKPYLDAMEATEPERVEAALKAFADGIAMQAAALARKGYWKLYDGSPEFVVMFVPGDQFVDAALSRRPDLLEFAANLRVLLASPSSLIAMLRAVHIGYQEHRLAEDALILRDLGSELHERMTTAMGYVSKLGGALNTAVERYNEFVGSYERRLEPTLKKFEEAGVKSGKELPEVPQVVVRARGVAGPTPLFEERPEA
jgi:DNA recombination protein RmuC